MTQTALSILAQAHLAERFPNVEFRGAEVDGALARVSWFESNVVFAGESEPRDHEGVELVPLATLVMRPFPAQRQPS